MYEAAFKYIDDTLWKVAGSNSELDHVKQAYAVGTGMLIKKLMNSKQ